MAEKNELFYTDKELVLKLGAELERIREHSILADYYFRIIKKWFDFAKLYLF